MNWFLWSAVILQQLPDSYEALKEKLEIDFPVHFDKAETLPFLLGANVSWGKVGF